MGVASSVSTGAGTFRGKDSKQSILVAGVIGIDHAVQLFHEGFGIADHLHNLLFNGRRVTALEGDRAHLFFHGFRALNLQAERLRLAEDLQIHAIA